MATAMDLSVGKRLVSDVTAAAVDLRLRPSELSSTRSLTVSPVDSPSSCSSVSPPDSMPVLVSSCSLVSPPSARPLLCLPSPNGLPTMVQYAAAAAQASSLGLASLSRLSGTANNVGGNSLKKSKLENHTSSNSSSRVNSSGSSSGHVSPSQLRSQRQSQKKSAVWQWFHHPRRQDGIVDEHHTKCMLCETELAFNSSGTTTTMLNHLKSRHDNEVNIEREMAIVRAMRMEKKIAKRGSKTAETLIIHKTTSHQSFATNFNNNNNNNSNIKNNNNNSETASSQAAQDAALVKKALQKVQRSLEKQNSNGVFAASNYHHPSLSCSSDSEQSSAAAAGTTIRQLLHKKKCAQDNGEHTARPAAAALRLPVNSSGFDQQARFVSSLSSTTTTTTSGGGALSTRGVNSLTQSQQDALQPYLTVVAQRLAAAAAPALFNDEEPLAKRSRKRKATPKQILPSDGAVSATCMRMQRYETADEMEVGSIDEKQSQGSVDESLDQEVFLDALIAFLCKDLYPASVFQQEGMQALLGTLAPHCVIPDVAELTSHMIQRVAMSRQKLACRLTCDSSMLAAAASVELWSATRQVLATITFHLLGEQFEGPLTVNMKTEECMKPNVLVINQVLACCDMLDLCDGRRPQQELIVVTNDAARLIEELEFCRQSEQHIENSMDAPKLLILSCFVSALDHILRAAVAPPKVRALLEKYPDFFPCLSEHSILRPDSEPLDEWRRLRNLLHSGTQVEQQLVTILKNMELLAEETLCGRLPLAAALRRLRKQEFVLLDNEAEELVQFKTAALVKLNDLYPTKGRISEILAAAEALRRPLRLMEDSEALLAELLRQGVNLDEANSEITSYIKAFCLQNGNIDAVWWQNDDHVNNWPNLAQLARRVLPLPVNCQRLPVHLESRRACLDKCGAALDATLALRENADITDYCR